MRVDDNKNDENKINMLLNMIKGDGDIKDQYQNQLD